MSESLSPDVNSPVNNADLAARLVDMIANEVVVHHDEVVRADTDLLMTGLVDSLGVVRIVGWMEDELDLSIDPTDVTLDNFQTVERMVAYVGRRASTVP
jgi:acyl carrier protein